MGDTENITVDKFSFTSPFFVGHRKGQLHKRFWFLILRECGYTGYVVIAENIILYNIIKLEC
jgi:hypothetical protein